MKLFMIKGVHHSGKTTLVTGIIKELKRRGYTVGSIKDIHATDFQMDRAGTDTFAHGQAGANPVVARGLTETGILLNHQMDVHQLLPFFKQDFLILEGDPGISCPNIVTGITKEDCSFRADEDTVGFSGIIADSIKEYINKPVFHNKNDINAITDFIEREAIVVEKEQQNERQLKLYFNDEEVPMVPFVEAIIRASIMGIVGELRGFKEDTKVRIEL